jgi:hypothetical protein
LDAVICLMCHTYVHFCVHFLPRCEPMPPNRIDFIARQDGIGLGLHVFKYGDVVLNPTPSTGPFVFRSRFPGDHG